MQGYCDAMAASTVLSAEDLKREIERISAAFRVAEAKANQAKQSKPRSGHVMVDPQGNRKTRRARQRDRGRGVTR